MDPIEALIFDAQLQPLSLSLSLSLSPPHLGMDRTEGREWGGGHGEKCDAAAALGGGAGGVGEGDDCSDCGGADGYDGMSLSWGCEDEQRGEEGEGEERGGERQALGTGGATSAKEEAGGMRGEEVDGDAGEGGEGNSRAAAGMRKRGRGSEDECADGEEAVVEGDPYEPEDPHEENNMREAYRPVKRGAERRGLR